MWPILIGAGLVALITKVFSDEDEKKEKHNKRKKIFISFAIEDEIYRDYLVQQAKDERSPFNFVDMSVKSPWNEDEWKKRCRTKIKRCDGMIVMLSEQTLHSSGVRWEIKCAKEEEIPVIGMQIKKNNPIIKLPELGSSEIIIWNWQNLNSIIDKF